MTRITLDQLSEYLNSGATLNDTISMIEMLKEYKEEIETGIAEWHDLIPEVPADNVKASSFSESPWHWGDRARRKQLHAIVIFLRRQGFVPNLPKLAADGDSCVWEVVKGDDRGELSWDAQRGTYQMSGLTRPTDDYEPTLIPTFLVWC